jgi:hypothetical protein
MNWKLIAILALSVVAALFVFVLPDGLCDDDAGGQVQSEQLKSEIFVIARNVSSPRLDNQQTVLASSFPRTEHSLPYRTDSFAVSPTLTAISSCVLIC